MNSRQDKGPIALCAPVPFLKQYLFYETNLFTVVNFWLTQCSIIIMRWFKLYPNQSWHKHILFNLFKQYWIKHNATSLSVVDCKAAHLYINGECMKVGAGILANLTLPTHSLTYPRSARHDCYWLTGTTQKLSYVGYLIYVWTEQETHENYTKLTHYCHLLGKCGSHYKYYA